MARKKKTNRKAMRAKQSDPWETWCDPVPNADAQSQSGFKCLIDDSECPFDQIELSNAIFDVANDIVPEVPDIKKHPIPELESLHAGYSVGIMSRYGDATEYTTGEISERIFKTLKIFREVWPYPKAVKRLKDLSKKLVHLLNAGHGLTRKKLDLANTMGLKDSAAKLEQADRKLCMIELSGNIEKDAKQLFLVRKITPEEFHIAMRSALKLDREATEEINSDTSGGQCTDNINLQEDINPNEKKKDAKSYMARLVCHVWCLIPKRRSKSKATDYVFRDAKDGDRYFGDCVYARRLLDQYNYSPSTIQLEAAKLHAVLQTFRKKGMEYPESWHEMVRKSKLKEDRDIKLSKQSTRR